MFLVHRDLVFATGSLINEHGNLSSLPGLLPYFYLPEAVFSQFLTLKAGISLWGSKEKSKMSNDSESMIMKPYPYEYTGS